MFTIYGLREHISRVFSLRRSIPRAANENNTGWVLNQGKFYILTLAPDSHL